MCNSIRLITADDLKSDWLDLSTKCRIYAFLLMQSSVGVGHALKRNYYVA
uniref:Uncharacterized protein n=1 Tax=Anguilla anguilla TaxID=7936 RepID=A0A0E9RJZ9_ANGAN